VRLVVWQKFTGVSDVIAAFIIIIITLMMEAARFMPRPVDISLLILGVLYNIFLCLLRDSTVLEGPLLSHTWEIS
jgi:hypothetical protein